MSIIEEGPPKKVRMAHLAIVGSHSVNGVAELHTKLLKERLFRDFDRFYPSRFNSKTNGITPRRWLLKANPELAGLISEHIGSGWITNLEQLRGLEPLADDADFRRKWQEVKMANKKRLAEYIKELCSLSVDTDSMFDVQVKRIHEYKRQLLNVLHVIYLYHRILRGPTRQITPRTVIFAGKAAPSYCRAKLIIKLISSIGDVVNNDPADQRPAEGGLSAQLQRLPGGEDHAGRRSLRADLHRRHRGLRHRQYEILPERRPDHRHPGRCQYRDPGGGRCGKLFSSSA